MSRNVATSSWRQDDVVGPLVFVGNNLNIWRKLSQSIVLAKYLLYEIDDILLRV
jgi:hypothetical protein